MNFKRTGKVSFLTCAVMSYGSSLLASEDEMPMQLDMHCSENYAVESCDPGMDMQLQEKNSIGEHLIEDMIIPNHLVQESVQQENSPVVLDLQEERVRDAFIGLLTFVEIIHEADKVAQEVEQFLKEYNVTPMTKVRDFADVDSPRISLLRLAAHTARLDGQEGKFVLLEELIKQGGNPFVVEEGERFSLAQENALCAVQLCNCNQAGYLGIYDYENASEKIKAKARKRHRNLCKNSKRIQDLFEEYGTEMVG